MAVTNFKRTLWESAIIESLKEITVADIITKKPTKTEGSKAIFGKASLTTGLKDYTGVIDWEDVNTEDIELLYDKKKYFAFAVDDCDKVQLAGDVMLPIVNEQTYQMKSVIDKTLFNEAVTGAKASNVIGSSSAKKDITTPEMAYDFIVDLGTKLDNNKAPQVGRYVIGSPEFINLLSKDKRVIDNTTVLPNGVVVGMEINGMKVIKTADCPLNKVIAMSNIAVGYGKQIDEIEAMRLQSAFKDGIRGLVQYGVKTLQGEAIAVLHYSITQ